MKLRFCDLFAGIGGLRLAFEQACRHHGLSYQCVMSSEIDEKACDTYELNFNERPIGDIRQIEKLPACDFLLAGFPCQTFSYAGKREGFGDTRGTLFFEIERLIQRVEGMKPRTLFLENVRGLVTHDKGRTFQTILRHLKQLGYEAHPIILNSCHYGVPQNRVRIYIVAQLAVKPIISIESDLGPPDSHTFKSDLAQPDLFGSHRKHVLVRDVLEKDAAPKYNCSQRFVEQLRSVVGPDLSKLNGVRLIDYRGGSSIHSWELGMRGKCSVDEREFMNLLIANRRRHDFGIHQDGKKLSLEQIKSFYKKKNITRIVKSLIRKGYLSVNGGLYNPVCGNMSFEVFKFLDPNSISITLVSSDAHRLGVVQNNIPRRLTPRECARLQGFPDSFKVNPADNAAYRQFGNSVSVPVIEAILNDYFAHNNEPKK